MDFCSVIKRNCVVLQMKLLEVLNSNDFNKSLEIFNDSNAASDKSPTWQKINVRRSLRVKNSLIHWKKVLFMNHYQHQN